MRASRRLVLLLAALLLLLVSARAMNNADLLKMKEAGISEDTIVYAMGIHPAEYDASPEALIALKKAGMSDIIILKLISLQPGAKRPTEAAPATDETKAAAPAAAAPGAKATAPEPAPVPAKATTPQPAAAPPRTPPSSSSIARSTDKAAAPSRRVALRSSATDAPGATEPAAAPAPASPSPPAAEKTSPAGVPPLIYPAVGGDYFTRYSFHYERGRHLTTNYARGSLLPINTRVKLVSMADDELVLQRLDTRDRVRVKNVEKYSRKPLADVARQLLSAEKMPVDQQPTAVAIAIRHGELLEGMTKEQALMARGYPPSHRTPSLNADKWVYWSSRFIRHTITFEDGHLLDGRGVEERDEGE